MDKNTNIFVDLRIEKDQTSGELTLNIHFDKNANNFSMDKNAISWWPTFEEIDFIVQAFSMLSKSRRLDNKYKEEVKNRGSPPLDEKTEVSSISSSEKKIEPFEPLKMDNDTDKSSSSSDVEEEDSDEKIFVQASEKTINEVLKRKQEASNDDSIVEVGDKNVIDKVLSHKKKK